MRGGRDRAAELALADRHIAEAEERIARQAEYVAGASESATGPRGGELLRLMRQSLELMRRHRQLILAELGRGR